MGIFSRLADIVNANISGLLARAENPEKMLRLMVQEMEETLVETRASAARLIADRKTCERRLERLRHTRDDWRRKAERAVERGREDLAKGALVEKAKVVEMTDGLEEELGHLADGLARYEEDIAKLESKLREAKAKQKAMLARHETASHRLKVSKQVHDRRLDDALARFEHMERRIDSKEGEVDSMELGRGKTLAEEIDQLDSDVRIEDELEELRRKVRGEARE